MARRYGISRGLLTQWRRAYRKGLLEGGPATFSPVEITAPLRDAHVSEVSARVEITLANGRRLAIGASIDNDTLARLVQVLERA